VSGMILSRFMMRALISGLLTRSPSRGVRPTTPRPPVKICEGSQGRWRKTKAAFIRSGSVWSSHHRHRKCGPSDTPPSDPFDMNSSYRRRGTAMDVTVGAVPLMRRFGLDQI